MARLSTGTITSTGAAHNLDLGFTPDYIIVENYTNYGTPANGEILKASWQFGMADAYAFIETFDNTGGALGTLSTLATTNGFTPYETASASLFTSTVKTITAISQAAEAVVTIATHGLAVGDVFTITQVVGMIEINRLRAKVTYVADANNVWINVDTTGFTAYVSGGKGNVISDLVENVGEKGITLGTSVVGANLDVLYYRAFLNDPIL